MMVDKISELNNLNREMSDLSTKMSTRINEMEGDVITKRNDLIVNSLWQDLCERHRRAMLICASMGNEKPGICSLLEMPQKCVEVLHLSAEETCCTRALAHIRPREAY